MEWIDNVKDNYMIPQSWIIHYLKMYKISDEVIKLIEKTMETWRVELTAGGKTLAEVKIQRGVLQGDAQLPLLFFIVMIPLNYILRKFTAGYKITKSQEKINHLMYLNDIKLFAKNEKKKNKLETLIQAVRIYSQDIGIKYGIEKCTMQIMKSGKRQMTEKMEQPNQEKSERSEKRKRTNTRDYWKRTPSNKWGWKKKIKKRISGEQEKYSKPNYVTGTS